jgi:nucleotide-binding universal stress UspA family protein
VTRRSNILPRMSDADGPILVAFDGSDAARRAVAEAARLLRPRQMLVVTVWEPGLAFAATAGSPDVTMTPMVDPSVVLDVDRELEDSAKRVSRAGAEFARSLGAEAEPLAVADAGDIARTIITVAREHDSAAIVVGTRGLSGIRARLEGSTSKGILKHAPCPVIVVHEDGEDE